ncbi:hypothetical protein AKO1_013806 [Acrasis kona]|uniref:Uncharacterized protein n=1 Tax=Acrasis kona TaxID=1008807 RepID=A0AAW2YKP6_9EUKA
MIGSSSNFVFFNSKNINNLTNSDATKRVKGSTGDIPFSITDDSKLSLQLAPEKSLCFNPPTPLPGFQTFVSFNFPSSLPNSMATGIALVQASGTNNIRTLVTFSNSGQQNLRLDTDVSSDNNPITIQANTDYVLIIGVDSDVSFAQSSIIDVKQNVLSSMVNYFVDGNMIDAIFNDKYYICVTTSGLSRGMNAINSTMNVLYYGSQKRSVLVTSNATSVPRNVGKLSPGAIAGITIGVIAFCVIFILIIVVIMAVIIGVQRKRKVPVKVPSSVEMQRV